MKKDGIPPKRTGCSEVEFSPATREARVRFPASARKKNLFKLLSFALLAHRILKFDELPTQCGSILYFSELVILSYRPVRLLEWFVLRHRLILMCQSKAYWLFKKIGSFVSLAGSFFTKLNVYKYEILLLRTSLLQP